MAVDMKAPSSIVVEYVDINILQPHPRNVQIYGVNEDISELAKKIQEKGRLDYNIVINQHSRIISGHRRWQATKSLGWSTVPVERRTYVTELEELEALLIANVYRDKTNIQRASEYQMWLEVYKEKNDEKQKAQGDKGHLGREDGKRGANAAIDKIRGQSVNQELAPPPLVSNLTQGGVDKKSTVAPKNSNKPKNQPAPKSRDQAAKDVGLSATSANKSVKALNAVKQLREEGKDEEAKVLEKVANKSLDAASKLADLSKEENVAMLSKIAKGEVKDVKEAKKVVKKEKIEQLQKADESVSLQEEVKERKIEHGQIWKLGRHLLYCGDSSSQAFQQIVKGKELSFAFADPPYNAGVDKWDLQFEWKHDYLAGIAPIVAVTPGISAIKDFMCRTSMPYRWSMAYWLDNGMTRGAIGFGKWMYVALFANNSVYRCKQDFDRISISSNEWEGEGDGLFEHKGRKPLAMMLHIIETFTDANNMILDPFLGTGTTLVVCEKASRTCIGAELNPEYCATIINRWEKISGGKAEEVTNSVDTIFSQAIKNI